MSKRKLYSYCYQIKWHWAGWDAGYFHSINPCLPGMNSNHKLRQARPYH